MVDCYSRTFRMSNIGFEKVGNPALGAPARQFRQATTFSTMWRRRPKPANPPRRFDITNR
jgi:hypothetical protein